LNGAQVITLPCFSREELNEKDEDNDTYGTAPNRDPMMTPRTREELGTLGASMSDLDLAAAGSQAELSGAGECISRKYLSREYFHAKCFTQIFITQR